jgi:hypothetical protein
VEGCEDLTERGVADLELGAEGVAGERDGACADEVEDAICEGDIAGVVGRLIGVDDGQVRDRVVTQGEPQGIGRGDGAVLDREREVVVAASQVEIGIAPGVQISGAAERLTAESGGGVLAQVVDEDDGEVVSALEIAQLAI